MKICWDNLEGFYLSKFGNFRKGNTPYYERICAYCGEFCLTRKKIGFCDKSCSAKFRFNQGTVNVNGKNNPNYKDGRSSDKNYIYKYLKANKNKHKRSCKNWRENNKHRLAARTAKRRALKLKQTPKIIDKNRINWLYFICNRLNFAAGRIAFHVDHIIPLALGGLHHENNLRILNANKNMSEGSKIKSIMRKQYGISKTFIKT